MENSEQATGKSLWNGVIRVLFKQAETYEKFNAFLKVKQKAIITGDTKHLKTLEGEEKSFVSTLEQLEDVRRESAIECVGGEAPTLRDLLAGSPQEHRPELEDAAVRLMEAINKVVVTHKSNTELLEEAIHFVQFNLNLLTSSGAPTDSTYGASGRLREAENKVKGLLNKQV
jgi:flagellar biosynthesis/type III secretory pathway chaperone